MALAEALAEAREEARLALLRALAEHGSAAAWTAAALFALLALRWLLGQPQHRVPADRRARFLVTGAAAGVGQLVTQQLLDAGHRVVATDKDFKRLKSAAVQAGWLSRPGLDLKPLDVTAETDWESATRQAESNLDGLDGLINCAAVSRRGTAAAAAEDVDAALDVNVKGVAHGIRVVGALMREQVAGGTLPLGGHIVALSSLLPLAPARGVALDVAAHYAVRGLALCAAKDLEPDGVYISLVSREDSRIASSGLPGADMDYATARAITAEVLLRRPRELVVTRTRTAALVARLADALHGSRLLTFVARR